MVLAKGPGGYFLKDSAHWCERTALEFQPYFEGESVVETWPWAWTCPVEISVMLNALVILVLLPVTGLFLGWLPWAEENSSFATLLAATVMIILASLLVSAWINVEKSSASAAHSLLWRPLTINLLLLALLLAYHRYDDGVHSVLTVVVSAVMLSSASLLGIVTARGLKHPTELIPVCVVAAWADLCSITAGPTHAMVGKITDYYSSGQQGPAPLADALLIKTLVPGTALPVPLFGVADWIIVAFLSAALVRLKLCPGPELAQFSIGAWLPFKYVHVAPLSLWLALTCAHLSGRFIPALVPICAFVLIWVLVRYPQSRRLSRRELLLTGLFPLLMTLGVTLL